MPMEFIKNHFFVICNVISLRGETGKNYYLHVRRYLVTSVKEIRIRRGPIGVSLCTRNTQWENKKKK